MTSAAELVRERDWTDAPVLPYTNCNPQTNVARPSRANSAGGAAPS